MKENKQDKLKAIIAGGGTGGHIYTGIALAEELRKRDRASDILFVGTRKGLEKKLVPAEGFPIKFIVVRGLKGKGIIETARNMFLLPLGAVQSFFIILKYKPGIVFGVGGYASGPLCMIAAKMKKPVVIVEQNSIPGITNRLLSKSASFAAVAYEKAREYLQCRCEMTGVPLRAKFYDDENDASKMPVKNNKTSVILVLGGSQGAHGINQAMINACSKISVYKDKIKIIHQSGKKDYEAVKRAYEQSGFNAEVLEFIIDVKSYYSASDFVISRSGAITTAEITYMGLPAAFIPLPNSIYDHQMKNASALAESGAALLIKESDLTPDRIESLFQEIINGKLLDGLKAGMKKYSRINASRLVIDKSLELLKSGKQDEKND